MDWLQLYPQSQNVWRVGFSGPILSKMDSELQIRIWISFWFSWIVEYRKAAVITIHNYFKDQLFYELL